MSLQQAIDRSLGDEGELLLGEAHRQLARGQLRLGQGQVEDPPALHVGDAVPDPIGPRRPVRQRFRAAILVALIPSVKGSWRDTKVAQCPANWQRRLLDQADDLELLGGGVSHSRSSPSAIMLFLRRRRSSACSATTSFRAWASWRSALTSSVVAARAVSPASRRLPFGAVLEPVAHTRLTEKLFGPGVIEALGNALAAA